MDPALFVLPALYGLIGVAVVAVAVRRRVLARRQAELAAGEAALAGQGFAVERVVERFQEGQDADRREIVLAAALRAQRGDRVTLVVEPGAAGARAVLIVEPLRAVERATLHVAREGRAARVARTVGMADVEIGDPAFDARYRVGGWPQDQARAFVAAPDVRAAIDALFLSDAVVDARTLAAREVGALRVGLVVATGGWDQVGLAADRALVLADALDAARFVDPLGPPAPVVAAPPGALGAGSGAPVVVPRG